MIDKTDQTEHLMKRFSDYVWRRCVDSKEEYDNHSKNWSEGRKHTTQYEDFTHLESRMNISYGKKEAFQTIRRLLKKDQYLFGDYDDFIDYE